jgi:hypothetical protein
MMAWTEAEGDALFRQPPESKADEDKSSPFDSSPERMRRLRNPFDTTPAEAPDAKPDEDDDRS